MRVWKIISSLVALCLLASCDTVSDTAPDSASDTVSTTILLGYWPTCLEPGTVEKAQAAADRGDFDAWWTLKCGGRGFRGTPVRVIRCAADLTPVRLKYFFGPVPLDDGLPDEICEVELFFPDGGTAIAYTRFLNIERYP